MKVRYAMNASYLQIYVENLCLFNVRIVSVFELHKNKLKNKISISLRNHQRNLTL